MDSSGRTPDSPTPGAGIAGAATIDAFGADGYLVVRRAVATDIVRHCVDVIEEAAALGVPCLSLGVRHVGAGSWLADLDVGTDAARATHLLWRILFNGFAPAPLPTLWDGHSAELIAARLGHWLRGRATPRPSSAAALARPPG